MKSKDVTIIIILLIILAIVYKLMQSTKLQEQLSKGMAKKMGVEIKSTQVESEEEETEEVEHEEEQEEETEEEEQQEEQGEEEEEQEEEEPDGEAEVEEHDNLTGKLVVTKAPVYKVKKKKSQSKKIKAYEKIASVITDAPLQSGEIMERYENEFEEIGSNDFWLTLNYSIKKGLIKKYQISENPKKNIYGLPSMFDGEELKEEFKTNIS